MRKVVIVTGARAWPGAALVVVTRALDAQRPDLLVHGGCPTGVDEFADGWAHVREVDVHVFRAKWRVGAEFRRGAGHERNRRMLEAYPGVLVLAFPYGESRGTRGCMAEAMKRGHRVMVFDERGMWSLITPAEAQERT